MRRYSRPMLAGLLLATAAGLTGTSDDASAQRQGGAIKADQPAADESTEGRTIAVLGSSVARGWVTSFEAKRDLLNGWAFRLERLLKPRGWKVVNLSNPGDDTKAVLARIERDLLPTGARIVIIGLSMSNEGLENAKDPEKVLEQYRAGLEKIIQVCRKNGIAPVVGLCYPNDNYDAKHYAAIKKMNLLINTWDVPSIDLLGPADNGSGGWIEGYTFDLDHPDDVGHEEMFYAIVPSLFDAIESGKPVPPAAKSSAFITVTGERDEPPVSFVPEDVIHSYTVAVKVRPASDGCLVAMKGGTSWRYVDVDKDGKLRYLSSFEKTIASEAAITDGQWHDVVVSHHFLLGQTELFLDGASVGRTNERVAPLEVTIGGYGRGVRGPASARADYRDLLIYRSPLNADEVRALHGGALLPASREVYAPLNEERLEANQPLVNLAQSLSRVVAYPTDTAARIAALERKTEQAEKGKRYIDPHEKAPIKVDAAVFDDYVGEYRVDSKLTLSVTKDKARLLLSPNRMGKVQLLPESQTKFFARVMGPEIGVTFVKSADGEVNELIFHQDGMNIPAKRVR